MIARIRKDDAGRLWSQADFSRKANICQQTAKKILSGGDGVRVQLFTGKAVADALGVDLCELETISMNNDRN